MITSWGFSFSFPVNFISRVPKAFTGFQQRDSAAAAQEAQPSPVPTMSPSPAPRQPLPVGQLLRVSIEEGSTNVTMPSAAPRVSTLSPGCSWLWPSIRTRPGEPLLFPATSEPRGLDGSEVVTRKAPWIHAPLWTVRGLAQSPGLCSWVP